MKIQANLYRMGRLKCRQGSDLVGIYLFILNVLISSFHQIRVYEAENIKHQNILFPMLIILYLNPLGQIIHSGIGCHPYTDNTQLYISLSKCPSDAIEVLNNCPTAVVKMAKSEQIEMKSWKDRSNAGWKGTEVLKGIMLPAFDRAHLMVANSIKSLGVIQHY